MSHVDIRLDDPVLVSKAQGVCETVCVCGGGCACEHQPIIEVLFVSMQWIVYKIAA